jgi:hypothetical protein
MRWQTRPAAALPAIRREELASQCEAWASQAWRGGRPALARLWMRCARRILDGAARAWREQGGMPASSRLPAGLRWWPGLTQITENRLRIAESCAATHELLAGNAAAHGDYLLARFYYQQMVARRDEVADLARRLEVQR